jgi:hypothetical protein
VVGAGDGWVVRKSFRARPKVPRHGPVRWSSRCQRTGRPMQGVPGGKAAMHKAAGKGGQCRVARVVRPPMLSAMRHGMLPSPGTISPKPRSAGEARASYCLRTTRVGAIGLAGPASLPINPRPYGRRGFRHALRSRPIHKTRQLEVPAHGRTLNPCATAQNPLYARSRPSRGVIHTWVRTAALKRRLHPVAGQSSRDNPRRHKPERSHFHGIA